MTPEVKELVDAANALMAALPPCELGGFCFCPKCLAIRRTECAIIKIDDDPQRDHEAALARRIAEDRPGCRMNVENIGTDDRSSTRRTP